MTAYTGIPRGNNVLVEAVNENHSSAPGFGLLSSATQNPITGYVRAVGPEVPEDVKVGQLILWDEFACYGSKIKLVVEDGTTHEYLLLKADDIRLHLFVA